jgi:hypothetical protein
MITIFCDFCQFSAKKMSFFSKTNVMITIFAKTNRSLSKKRQIFLYFFGENILKIITSVPGAFWKMSTFLYPILCPTIWRFHREKIVAHLLIWFSRDRCHDFKNIFDKAFCDINGVFCSNYRWFLQKLDHNIVLFEKNAIFSPKIGKNWQKLWS